MWVASKIATAVLAAAALVAAIWVVSVAFFAVRLFLEISRAIGGGKTRGKETRTVEDE